MIFIDHARVHVKAGDGGNGCVAFRREKFVPRGGPSGGDGGHGGSVYFRSTGHLNTLLPFRYQQHFRAQRGAHGSGSRRDGRKGADRIVEVPVGTQVFNDSTAELLFDFEQVDQTVLVARGGRGGKGNAAFATATDQAPRRADPGEPGEQITIRLELKVLADVGLIGFPNAGKSTLISVLSSARPKIADYPFTTLVPHLGVVAYGNHQSLVLADIPGLIAGAHQGSGLGDQFLRHVERCCLLVQVVDVGPGEDQAPSEAVEIINRELRLYSPLLAEKEQVVAASKMDIAVDWKVRELKEYCRLKGLSWFPISSATGQGLEALKADLVQKVEARR